MLFYVLLAAHVSQSESALAAEKSPAECNAEHAATREALQSPQCGLYVAESTIPGAGLGIFSAVGKDVGDVVGHGDVCVPVIDMYWHNGNPIRPNPFKDYFWAGHAMGMASETDTDDIEALCPGLDCVINCHLALVNVEKATPQYDASDALHREKDPGVGAFSPYHNGTTVASRDIPPGGELFKFYGDHWFATRKRIFGNIPLSGDYPAALALLQKFVALPVVSDSILWQDLYQLVTQTGTGAWESRRLNALPPTLTDARQAVDAGDMAVLHQPAATRSLEWLAQHGRCIDHIRPGSSTLPQAGRGAFSVRDLPAGTVVTTSPLHHVPNESFMNMYKFTKQEVGEAYTARPVDGQTTKTKRGNVWVRLMDQVKGYQL
jgi:hypothetical protein